MSFSLGDRVRDKVTGFTGIAVAKTVYLYSVPKVCVEAESLSNDCQTVEVWFAEARLDLAETERDYGFRPLKAAPRAGHSGTDF